MKITSSKLKTIISMFGLIIIETIISNYLKENYKSIGIKNALVVASLICLVSVVIELILWKNLTHEFFSPYTVFFIVLFIFCCGQSVGWLLNIDMGPKDMWNRVDHGITKDLLLRGLLYSSISISYFHLGAIIATKCDRRNIKYSKYNEIIVRKVFKYTAKHILIICIPAFIINSYTNIIQVKTGYENLYSYLESSSIIYRVIDILSNYYEPCLLMLLIAYSKDRIKRKVIIFAMLIDVIISLYIGGRSGAVMSLLAIVLAYHYFIKPFNGKKVIVAITTGYFGIAFLNTIAKFRNLSNKNVVDLFNMFIMSFSNVIGQFIGELGWSITSICWTMTLVPKSYSFRYGLSYLVSLIAWIPTFFFPNGHPVVKWGELSTWLQGALRMSYGPGYSMIAEAYLNFGEYGSYMLLIEGMVISYMIAQVSRKNSHKDILKSTIQIIYIMILMKSLIRSSVSIAFRQFVFIILPLYIIMIVVLKKNKKIKRR